MGLDFFGVEISGSIRTFQKQGGDFKEYELWIDPTPLETDDKSVDHVTVLRSLAFVQEVTVSIGMGMNSKVSLSLSPPFEEGIALINSNLVQWGVGQLQIQIGYSTGSHGTKTKSAVFGGLMQKPDVRIGTDVSITLNALGIGYALNLAGLHDPKHFDPGTTPAQAVLAVLNTYTREGADSTGINLEGIFADFDQRARTGGHPFFRPITSVVRPPKDLPAAPKPTPAAEKRTIGRKAKQDARREKTLSGDELKAAQEKKVADEAAARKTQEADALARTPAEKKALLVGVDVDGNALTANTGAVAFVPESYVLQEGPQPDGQQIFYLAIDQGPRNDWWFVYETCKNFGLELAIIDRNVRIRDADKWKKSGPVMEFALRGTIDSDAPIPRYPVLELSSPTTAMWIQPGVGEQILEDLNDNGEKNKVVVNDANTGITREGTQAIDPTAQVPFSSKPMDMASTFPGNPDTVALEAAKGEYKSVNNSRGIVVEVTSLGIPELEPGMVVKLSGAGSIFPDTYGVLEVEHRIGNSGFTTKWRGLSSSIPPQYTHQTTESKGAQTPVVDTSDTTIRPSSSVTIREAPQE